MTLVVVLLAVAVGVLALLVFGLLRTHAEILRALDRAGISLDDDGAADDSSGSGPDGSSEAAAAAPEGAPDLTGTVPAGGPTKIAVAGVPHFTLLAFLSSGCRTCQRFWEAFAEPDLDLPGGDTRLVIVGQDPVHDSESALAERVPHGVKAVLSSAAWEDYDVPGSPYFALVDGTEGRVVGAGSALEWDQLRGLLQQALDDAGLAHRPRSSLRASARSGRSRERRADEALLSAGIGPGHASLYPGQSGANGENLGGPVEGAAGENFGGPVEGAAGENFGGPVEGAAGENFGGPVEGVAGENFGGPVEGAADR